MEGDSRLRGNDSVKSFPRRWESPILQTNVLQNNFQLFTFTVCFPSETLYTPRPGNAISALSPDTMA